ncbi:SWIM zinc finger domain-containing protein [Daejeonella sp.]|uniref:SWIM zinc finger family protein n=1 Tax=Daejeonella sp. TaxID=2805397 RepID=UPI002731E9CD|nr:SWIM zinc finger family protein [Daejeonella sp.]MDP2414629.1 SWIM zinc finger family protein [Daejeonella sp.]
MLTLNNFDKQISGSVLNRGKQYYKDGAVMEIEEINDGFWNAEVEGSEFYDVKVQLNESDAIIDSSCTCPYDGDICKHVIAVLCAIREERPITTNIPAAKAAKKLSFEDLLNKISIKEYKEFVKTYALQSKDFKIALELAFSDKDDTIDLGKKYSDALKRVIRKHSDNGFVGYRDSFALVKDLDNFLVNVEDMIHKMHFRDAFAISIAILNEMRYVLTYCDDSAGNIGDTISETVSLIKRIATDAPINLREEVYNYLLKELGDKSYYEYGDFGYELFDIFETLAIDLSRSNEFFSFIDKQVSNLTGKYDDYRKEFFISRKIELLKLSGNNTEVENLVQQNLEIVEVRQGEINKFIQEKDYVKAKVLIKEGIEISDKKGHPGTTLQWEKELLRIAFLENDVELIRHYTKYFAFDRWFSKEYYDQWKATFNQEEWIVTIEAYIDETLKKILGNNERGRGKLWFTANPPVLSAIAPVYIEEGYWDRLLDLVKKETDLDVILQYHSHLSKRYPDELLALYLPAFELAGDHANARNQYKDVVNKMKRVIKDMPQFKADIVAVAQKLKSKYPRRPAMVDELNRIAGGGQKKYR